MKDGYRTMRLAAALACGLAVASTASSQEDANALIQSLYGQRIAAAEKTIGGSDDAAVGKDLLAAAQKAESSPSLLIALCLRTYDLCRKHPDGWETAGAAMHLLQAKAPARQEEVSAKLAELYRTMYARGTASQRRDAGEKLADLLLEMAHAARGGRRYAEAAKLAREALALAATLNTGARMAAAAASKQYDSFALAAAKAEGLRKQLSGDANTAGKARNDLITLLVVELDDPNAAAKVLTAEADEVLRTYVPMAAKPMEQLSAGALAELAAWYRSLAARGPQGAKAIALRRARDYCERHGADKGVQADEAARLKATLTLEEIQRELAKCDDDPVVARLLKTAVAAYSFERESFFRKGPALCLRDLSGKNNHGLVHGVRAVAGLAGGAGEFGNGDSVEIANAPSLQITGDQTIAMWLWPSALGARRNPYDKAYGGEGTMTLEPSGEIHYYHGTAGANAGPYHAMLTGKGIAAGEWSHVVLVRDMKRRKVRWYVNGKMVAEATTPYAKAAASTCAIRLGHGYAGQYLGKMDEFLLLGAALSEGDVMALYQFGKAGKALGR